MIVLQTSFKLFNVCAPYHTTFIQASKMALSQKSLDCRLRCMWHMLSLFFCELPNYCYTNVLCSLIQFPVVNRVPNVQETVPVSSIIGKEHCMKTIPYSYRIMKENTKLSEPLINLKTDQSGTSFRINKRRRTCHIVDHPQKKKN